MYGFERVHVASAHASLEADALNGCSSQYSRPLPARCPSATPSRRRVTSLHPRPLPTLSLPGQHTRRRSAIVCVFWPRITYGKASRSSPSDLCASRPHGFPNLHPHRPCMAPEPMSTAGCLLLGVSFTHPHHTTLSGVVNVA
eukprot:scaffold59583_cov28-Tisochrysis_lutea.AAC.1